MSTIDEAVQRYLNAKSDFDQAYDALVATLDSLTPTAQQAVGAILQRLLREVSA